MNKPRIALFPGHFDGLAADETKINADIFYLVAVGSPEESWAAKFLPEERLLRFQLDNDLKSFLQLGVSKMIEKSNITSLLKDKSISYLLLSTGSFTEFLKDWSESSNIKIISTDFERRKNFEHKIWFDKFLAENQIPRPQSQYIKIGSEIEISYRSVIQDPESLLGEGTFFVNNNQDLENLVESGKLIKGKEYLMRKFITGTSYGISVFISSENITLSSIRIQCFHQHDEKNKIFNGVQWVPFSQIGKNVVEKINQTFSNLGLGLHKNGYFGYANFDFIVDEKGEVYLIECNPRLSAATGQVILFNELTSGVDTGSIFLDEFVHPKAYSDKPNINLLPNTEFEGSVLFIAVPYDTSGNKIESVYDYGLYELQDNEIHYVDADFRKTSINKKEFFFSSDATKGDYVQDGNSIATIVSNYPLFNQMGERNNDAKIIYQYFKY